MIGGVDEQGAAGKPRALQRSQNLSDRGVGLAHRPFEIGDVAADDRGIGQVGWHLDVVKRRVGRLERPVRLLEADHREERLRRRACQEVGGGRGDVAAEVRA